MDQFKDPLMRALVEFIADSKFQNAFESFFVDNCKSFHDDDEQR